MIEQGIAPIDIDEGPPHPAPSGRRNFMQRYEWQRMQSTERQTERKMLDVWPG